MLQTWSGRATLSYLNSGYVCSHTQHHTRSMISTAYELKFIKGNSIDVTDLVRQDNPNPFEF